MAVPYNAEIMRLYAFWVGIVTLKILAVTLLTAKQRMRKKVFANHEDALMLPKARVAYDDEDVERVRRSHLNDLENIPIWIAVTYVYLGTGPSNLLAGILIRAFCLARISHTLSYAVFPKQPYRAISFFIGFGITMYQGLATVFHYY